MSQLIQIDLRPDARTLRQFGFIAVGGFGFLAAIAWYEVLVFSFGLGAARMPVAIGFATLALLSGLHSLVYPKANLPIYLAITIAAYPIGFVLSYVIMATLFYVIIAPIGLLLRVLGQDPMHRRLEPEAESYWQDAAQASSRSAYFKQF
jgi:hypothetical protein